MWKAVNTDTDHFLVHFVRQGGEDRGRLEIFKRWIDFDYCCMSSYIIKISSGQTNTTHFHHDSRQSRSSDEERQRKSHKRKKKRRKESRGRKKKKERRARRHSSPTYSDYEPENPLLRNKRRCVLSELSSNSKNFSYRTI